MMWLPRCPWPCFMSETNVLHIGFSEIGEDVDSLAFGFFSEILIANGAFWINLSHQLRADISQIFSNIFHSSPATYFILVGSYWKKGGSAPKKRGSGPHGPPPPLDPPLEMLWGWPLSEWSCEPRENTLPCAWWGNPLTPYKHCHNGLLD